MNRKKEVEFLFEVGTLRFVQRTWRQMMRTDVANVAEHTFRVAWIALLLAKKEGDVDTGKIAKMALIHDVPEVRTGDLNGLQKQYAYRDEGKALADTLQETGLEEMHALWQEYSERSSREAKIVKDADIIDQTLELREQLFNGIQLRKSWDPLMGTVKEKLFTDSAKELWQTIEESNPQDWDVRARTWKVLAERHQ